MVEDSRTSYSNLEEYLASKPTILEFAKFLFGWEPFDYQIAPLEDETNKMLLIFGRQSGKSTISAVKALYKTMMKEKQTALIVSPTQRQSSTLFRRIKRLLKQMMILHPEFLTEDKWDNKVIPFIARETQTVIEFVNDSEVISLPAGEDGSNLLGFTAHMIIIDECSRIKDEVFISLRPMFATTWDNSQFILISTPKGIKNYFYEAWKPGGPISDMGFKVYTAKSSQSPLITKEFLKKERESMTENEYMQEYEAKFIDEADTFFTLEEIESVMSHNISYKTEGDTKFEYYFGYDPAGVGEDEAVGVIIERRPDYMVNNPSAPTKEFAVVYKTAKKRTNQAEQIGLIKHLNSKWHFKRMAVDCTGLGTAFADELKECPVEPIVFSIKSIEELYNNGKKFFETRHLIMPKDVQMKKQLNDMKYEYRKGDGRLRVFNDNKHAKTDNVVALMLALWATKKSSHQIIISGGKSIMG